MTAGRDVLGQVGGVLGDPGSDDEREPASSRAARFAADSIPVSATTTTSCAWWRSRKVFNSGTRVVVSALLPSNRRTSRGSPEASHSSPTVACGSTRRSLLIPTWRRESSRSASPYNAHDEHQRYNSGLSPDALPLRAACRPACRASTQTPRPFSGWRHPPSGQGSAASGPTRQGPISTFVAHQGDSTKHKVGGRMVSATGGSAGLRRRPIRADELRVDLA